MSDYYYFEGKNDEWGFTPVPGEDYIRALRSIAKKHGVRVTDRMILEEIFGKQIISKKAKKRMKTEKAGRL